MKSSIRSSSAFTLTEVLIALALAGIAAAIFLPDLSSMFKSGTDAGAVAQQAAIQRFYTNWTGFGGTHPTSASPELTLAMLNMLSGAPDATISNTPNYYAVGGDAQAIVEPRDTPPVASTVRYTFSGAAAPSIQTVNGASEVVYGRFIIRFTPSAANRGTWVVVSK
jgi:prepilin-type N-terminal cleavage/methylation domain-containing protein